MWRCYQVSDTEILQKILNKLDSLEQGQQELKKGQQELKSLISDLEPKNANRHIELEQNLKEIKADVKDMKFNLQKLQIVTGQNCVDITYLKSVK